MPSSFGFAATVLESEAWLVQQLDLCALRIEPSLAAADGWWKGARVGVEQAPDAIRAYRAFPHVFVELVREAAPDPGLLPVIEAAQAGYARAHRSDDIGLRLLGKLFGESWAQRYIDQVLFPAPSDVPC